MKNFLKFLAADAMFCIAMAIITMLAYGSHCATEQHNPKRYEVIDSYHQFGTDAELEAIDAHYMSIDGDPDAWGHILMDNDEMNVEFGVDVYKDKGGLYLYEWAPDTGNETKRYLTAQQRQWVIKL